MSSGGSGNYPSERAGPWYLTAEQVENSPSRQHFIRKYGTAERARTREQEMRQTSCAFLQESGQKLRLCATANPKRPPTPGRALIFAGVLCRAHVAQASAEHCDGHRILPPLLCARVVRDLRTLSGGRHTWHWPPPLSCGPFGPRQCCDRVHLCVLLRLRCASQVATTCLFLASKVEETPKKLKDVVLECYKVQNATVQPPDPESQELWKLKEQVLICERELLRVLGFDLSVEHAYRPLLAYIKSISGTRDLAQIAWNFSARRIRRSRHRRAARLCPRLISTRASRLDARPACARRDTPSPPGWLACACACALVGRPSCLAP